MYSAGYLSISFDIKNYFSIRALLTRVCRDPNVKTLTYARPVGPLRRMRRVRLAVLTTVLLAGMLSSIPFTPAKAELILSSWNPNVPCTPILVTIEEILGNTTNALGGADKTGSRFDPGITTDVTGGNPKRWLTPGATPDGWVAPGPPCLITNAQGEVVSAFVQANSVQLVSAPPR
jgi:hypothetical protein